MGSNHSQPSRHQPSRRSSSLLPRDSSPSTSRGDLPRYEHVAENRFLGTRIYRQPNAQLVQARHRHRHREQENTRQEPRRNRSPSPDRCGRHAQRPSADNSVQVNGRHSSRVYGANNHIPRAASGNLWNDHGSRSHLDGLSNNQNDNYGPRGRHCRVRGANDNIPRAASGNRWNDEGSGSRHDSSWNNQNDNRGPRGRHDRRTRDVASDSNRHDPHDRVKHNRRHAPRREPAHVDQHGDEQAVAGAAATPHAPNPRAAQPAPENPVRVRGEHVQQLIDEYEELRRNNIGMFDATQDEAALRDEWDALHPQADLNALRSRQLEEGDEDEDGYLNCEICMEARHVGDEVEEMPCGHWFDSECLREWLNGHNTCPKCRRTT